MKTGSLKTTQVQRAKTEGYRARIIRDLFNVTWKMLAPTLLGIVIGSVIDNLLASSPAGFLIGAGIGFVIGLMAALRIIRQAEALR